MKKDGFQILINIVQGKSTHIGGEVRDLITYDVTLKNIMEKVSRILYKLPMRFLGELSPK